MCTVFGYYILLYVHCIWLDAVICALYLASISLLYVHCIWLVYTVICALYLASISLLYVHCIWLVYHCYMCTVFG